MTADHLTSSPVTNDHATAAPDEDPSAARLERALEALGVQCPVEARGRLAVLRAPATDDALADPALRDLVVRVAREHGFTHAALELGD